MLSIVTAVHNQLDVNRLFFATLKKYTRNAWELIVIDNASTDGSADFFSKMGARVIRNDGNYSYPHCQNQGIQAARFGVLAFLNNDVIPSPGWDAKLLEVMDRKKLEIASSCGVERVETRRATRYYRKKWSLVRNTIQIAGSGSRSLRLMHWAMYGNWEKFAEARWSRFNCELREGFIGSTIMVQRSALDKIGLWDERIQAADFDLYLRSKARHIDSGDIQPVHVALGVFIHHFIKMTFRHPRPPFKDQANLISLEDKWGRERVEQMTRDLE
jgi:GT2 family glycosyltransferase